MRVDEDGKGCVRLTFGSTSEATNAIRQYEGLRITKDHILCVQYRRGNVKPDAILSKNGKYPANRARQPYYRSLSQHHVERREALTVHPHFQQLDSTLNQGTYGQRRMSNNYGRRVGEKPQDFYASRTAEMASSQMYASPAKAPLPLSPTLSLGDWPTLSNKKV